MDVTKLLDTEVALLNENGAVEKHPLDEALILMETRAMEILDAQTTLADIAVWQCQFI